MEEIKAFWEGFKEILNHPLIIGGTSVTLLSVIALLVRLFLSAPNKKQIITIKGDLASVRKEQEQFITKEQFNSLIGWQIQFVADDNFAVIFASGITWKYGTPTFNSGEEYTIIIEKRINNDYYAYLL